MSWAVDGSVGRQLMGGQGCLVPKPTGNIRNGKLLGHLSPSFFAS